MQNKKQRESLRMTRTYLRAGIWMKRLREKPSVLPPELLWPSTGRELLSPTMLEKEGEKSVLEEGDSAWLELGVFSWSTLLSSTATHVRVVLTSWGSSASPSCWHGPIRMGKLLDLKLFPASMYWSWSSRISIDSDRSLPVSSLSDEVMAQGEFWASDGHWLCWQVPQ